MIADFVEDPPRAATAAARARPLGLGALGFLVGGLSFWVGQFLLRISVFGPSGPASLVVYCAGPLLMGIVLAGLFHFLAEVLGGEGSAVALFVLLGLSELVWALMVPAALLMRLFYLDGWVGAWLLYSLLAGGGVWLKVRSLRDTHHLSAGKAWLVLGLPYVGVALLFLAVLILAVVGLVHSVLRMIS